MTEKPLFNNHVVCDGSIVMAKRYLLRVDGETESTEKDFSLRVSKEKRVRENAEKDSLC